MQVLHRIGGLLRRINRLRTVRSKLTFVILTGSLIVYGGLLASQHQDRRSTAISAADATHQVLTSMMAREFGNALRRDDLRAINRIIIETIRQIQTGPIHDEYFGLEAPSDPALRRANLEVVGLGIYDTAGRPIKVYVSPQHREFSESTLSIYGDMARSSGGSVTCLEADTEFVALPLTPNGGKPIGTLVVSWNMAPKFAVLNSAFWRDAAIGGLATLALVAFLVFVLGRLVTRPVGALTRHVSELGMSGEPGFVDDSLVARRDEIGVLAGEFNKMVEALADSRQKLQNQSYVNGMAEMASGVLHNIRNALNPISVGIWKLEETARGATLGKLDAALVELSDPATPAERKQKLISYVRGTGDKLVTQQHRLADEIKDLGQHSRHIEQILQDVDLTGKRRRQAEPIDLDKLAEECARMIPRKEGQAPVLVEIDTALARLAPAFGNRITITQVLGNLVLNAAESVRSSAAVSGRIVISGNREQVDNREMIRLSVRDNGEGIAPDAIGSLFQRGYSTKKEKKGGIGLHWCANSIIAMGGKIYASSDGKGQGATFHLLLPMAPSRPAESRSHAA